ncbi:HEXXH motif domain-containing protein [Saccharopolyspora sp. K220]|uniref:HEXXH motif domain-containing protein n=1 Tax=Saccharopolyspora soli TaxID=2926618 RepID=UPI001F56F149|nr:HEXXH motif domain-containing protein [Saccharopolyspora soli]MCI2420108.1 HEXXH motif domain-containing protein [Saccharopolyspora soli]
MRPEDNGSPCESTLLETYREPRRHRLPRLVFDEICSGAVRANSIVLLIDGQYSRRLLLLRSLMEFAATTDPRFAHTEHAWRLLSECEERDPEVVKEILMYPTVGVWVRRALRNALRQSTESAHNSAELGYLQLVAAAAAIRSQLPCRIRVPVSHGRILLPTLGQIRLTTSFPLAAADLHNSPHGIEVHAMSERSSVTSPGPTRDSSFSPIKNHVASARGIDLAVWIDDIDPYREFSDPRPPRELDQISFTEWCKALDEAWEILTFRHPDKARELSACLTTVAPIDSASGLVGASSTAAFGGVALPIKHDAIELAEVLVHEVQHSKLNALFNLVTLVRDNASGAFYAPWRDDPRPISGMLHGIYAFMSVIEFWCIQRRYLRDAEARRAHFWFAYRRDQVRRALTDLESTRELTALGHELVQAVSRRVTACEQESVPDDLSALVADLTADHYATWRLRHMRSDAPTVEAVATSWLEGREAPDVSARQASVRPNRRHRGSDTRLHLLTTKALDEDRFASLVRRSAELSGSTPKSDVAYCTGDYRLAMSGYLKRVLDRPDDGHAWVGLGLSLRARGEHLSAIPLLRAPEIVMAAHRQIRAFGGASPSVLQFVEWMGTGMAAQGGVP